MTITKPRSNGNRRRRRGGGGGRRGPPRRKERLRTEAEQLDYEMELLRAQRDGREDEFKAEERLKLHAKKAQQLDDEMDDYFKKKAEPSPDKDPEKKDDPSPNGDTPQKPPSPTEQPAQPAEAAAN